MRGLSSERVEDAKAWTIVLVLVLEELGATTEREPSLYYSIKPGGMSRPRVSVGHEAEDEHDYLWR
jgi:hypothetical protein